MPTDPVPPADRTLTVVPTGPETLAVDGAAAHALPAGQRFGDYDLLDELARGGMGVVYKARQRSVNRVVALKMILAGRFASDTDRQRFQQEAEAAANLDHSHILPIYEVGAAEGRSYFTMKLVEGGSLADLLKGESPRTNIRGVVALLEQVARGVHYAHQRGVLHRDLKPSNILLVDPATPVITDFGLAKKVEGDSSLTQSGAVVGTPSYMAPEQARGSKAITTAADVYSLGAILYECLTGRPPFRGENIAQTLRMVEEQEPVPPRRVNPECDPDLEAVALKCLEKDPARRYETAGALADDLARWLRNEPVTARRAGVGRRSWKWVRRNPAVTVLTLSIVAALIAGASISAIYAVKADKRAKEAAANEREARKQAAAVKQREEVLQDVLDVALFQQARAVRLAGRPGWRARSLQLLQAGAQNRDRPRQTEDRPVALPDLAELRGEAVMALIARDAHLVREVPLPFAGAAHFSGDGRRLVQIAFSLARQGEWDLGIVDLTTGRDLHRQTVTAPDLGDWEKRPPAEVKVDPAYLDLSGLFTVLAVNADGTRAATGGPNGGLTIREVPTGRQVVALPGPARKDAIASAPFARFSPDGRRVIAVRNASDGVELLLWDVDRPTAPRVLERRTGKKSWRISAFAGAWSGEFSEARFSPDGTRVSLATSDRKAARVLDVTADPPATVADVPAAGEVVAAEWHPAEPVLAVLAAGAGRKVSAAIWDVKENKARAACDGEFAAGGKEFAGPFAAFSPDGRWLAVGGGGDPAVRVFGARDGAERFRLTDVGGTGVSRLFWTPDGDLAVAGAMESLRVWRADADPACDTVYRLRAGGRPAFSPDGRWLAVFAPTGPAADGPDRPGLDRVALVDRRTGAAARYLPGLTDEDRNGLVFFSADGARVVTAGRKEVVVREVATGAEVLRRRPPKAEATGEWRDAFFAPDGRLTALIPAPGDKEPGRLALWDVAADRPGPTVGTPAAGFSVGQHAVSRDGTRLLLPPVVRFAGFRKAPSDPPTARLYELPAGRLVAEFPAPLGPAGSFASPVALGPGGAHALWFGADIETPGGGPTWVVQALPAGAEVLRGRVRDLRAEYAHDFSPDGRVLAVGGSRGQVELWDLDARALLFRYEPHGGRAIHYLTFGPDGDLASAAEGDDRLVILRMKHVRARLAEMGLGW